MLKIDDVLEKGVRETHTFLAHKADNNKLKAELRKNTKGNVTKL